MEEMREEILGEVSTLGEIMWDLYVGNIVIDGKGGSTQEKEAALKQRKEKEAQRKQ